MSNKKFSCIVRIFNDNEIVGSGFLVKNKLVLTCAHVVLGALGLEDKNSEIPDGNVKIDFPFNGYKQFLTAHIVHWQIDLDFAILELKDNLPCGVNPENLIKSMDLYKHNFKAFGFPKGHDDGVCIEGEILHQQARGLIQIMSNKNHSYWVEGGFSGSPIWDIQLMGVVGIIVETEKDPEIKAAWMIPSNLLIDSYSYLKKISLDDNSLKYQKERLTKLKIEQKNSHEPWRFRNIIDEIKTTIANCD